MDDMSSYSPSQEGQNPEPKAAEKKGGHVLTAPELSAFSGQLSLVLKAGITAYEGVTIMRDDAEEGEDKKILSEIAEQMEMQYPFSEALKSTGVFPSYFINMVEIGERTGNLDSVMRALEKHYDREENIRRSTQNAVLYPLILSAMMIAVIVVLLVRVMPVFNDVFRGLGTEMTGLPAFLMSIGEGLRTYAVVFMIVTFAVMLCIFLIYRTQKGRDALRRFGRKFPSVRKSDHAVAACRFASAMSMTLSAGLTPEESMDLAIQLNEDPDFGEQLKECEKDMIEGRGFADTLYKHNIFSGIYAKMLTIGQKTGSMDQVMSEVADMYQEEIDTRLNNRLATLEPLLVVLMSVAIGAILLSVMFPLLGIMSSI